MTPPHAEAWNNPAVVQNKSGKTTKVMAVYKSLQGLKFTLGHGLRLFVSTEIENRH